MTLERLTKWTSRRVSVGIGLQIFPVDFPVSRENGLPDEAAEHASKLCG